MSAENQQVFDIDVHEHQEVLAAQQPAVRLIVQAQRELGYDTAYHHFKHDYFGKPEDRSMPLPAVSHTYERWGAIDYPGVERTGYSDNLLVQVRTSPDVSLDHPHHYLLILGDLLTQTMRHWEVREVKHYGMGDATMSRELFISEAPILDGLHGFPEDIDPLKALIAADSRRRSREHLLSERGMLLSTNQGGWIKKPGGQLEQLAPFTEVVTAMSRIDQLGHWATAAATIPLLSVAPAPDTIAA